ncbi:MAG: TonB-dependent receptor [Gemmatimonadetes bacterium]|nr:TonB-dependent receptor [Gemmatimonadota bacterium]
MRHGLLLIGLLCFALSPALAQTGQIHGRVTDDATGEPLPGATIAVLATDQRYGTLSNTEGHYTLDLPLGAYTLQFSFIGYTTQRPDPQAINADAPIALDIRLSPTTIALSEMTVTPGRFAIMGNATGGRQTLSQEEIQSIPQFGDDVFRAVTRLPGIAGSDFSARFTIRGGEADEVLVRVDGVELYDPFHLKDIGGGALSIVDIALIEGVDLLTGGFPAEYGDRMSGVFDIRTRTPEPGHTRASLGLSMMNARAYIEGANKRSAWFFSARRGYLDLVLRVMGEDENFSPKYNDAFAKYTYQLNDQHKLQASLLRSHDDLDFVEDNDDRSNTEYGNTYSWLSLDSALSRKLHARTTLLGGRISDQRDGLTLLDDRRSVDFTVADERQFDFLSLRQDWNFAPAPTHYLKWGFDLRHLDAWYDYRSEQRISERDSAGTVQSHFDTTANALDLARYTLGLYAADRIRLADPVALELGLRYDYAGHTNDQVVSPRLNIVYTPDRNTSLRAGWGYFHQSQGIHQLDIQDGETAFHPAQRAEHRVLGLERFFANGLHLRVEAYDKKLTSLQPTYRNWLNAIEIFPELQDDRVRLDFDGVRSHGLEVYLKRDTGGRFTWWMSYALARVEEDIRSIRTDQGTIPFAAEVPGRFDQRHTLSFDLNYRPSARWRFNMAWQYRSGWPYTDRTLRLGETAAGEFFFYDQVGEPNATRYPAFHRLDLRLNRAFKTSKGQVHAYLELTNLYNHGNVRTYEYNFECTNSTTPDCHYRKDPEFWFKLLPSIGLNWNWDL